MLDNLKKWWNRKWSNWEHYDTIDNNILDRTIHRDLILRRVSNDGLVELKKIKVF
jgi:hypothetical protein